MVDGKTFKETIAEEKQKFKEMDAKKKWKYFKDYYLLGTVIFLAILISFLSWLFGRVIFEKETVSSGMSVNLYISDEDYYKFTDGYLDFSGANKKKETAVFALDTYIDFEGTEQAYTGYEDQMVIYAQVSAGAIYYLLTDDLAMRGFIASDLILSPDSLLSADIISELADRDALVYTKDIVPEDFRAGYDDIYAIDVSKLGYSADGEETYLLFTVACQDNEVYAQSLVEFFESL